MDAEPDPPVALCLYVAGDSAGSRRAKENLDRLVKRLSPSAEMLVVDVLDDPAAAEAAGILATPTLSLDGSDPPRRIVGDLSDIDRVLHFFGLVPREPE